MPKPMTVALAAALAVPVLAVAQTPPAAPAPAPVPAAEAAPAAPVPELPKPAPELQKLAFLKGDWIHDEKYEAGPMGPGGKGAGRSRNAWVLGEHHLYMVYAGNTPMGKMEGRGFLRWDAGAKLYALDWFDNMGLAFHYKGDFGPDGTLTLGGEYTHGGQKVREQLTVQKQEEGQLKLTSALAVGDGAELKTVAESILTAAKP
jgi:hypothetical protein